MGKIFRLLSPPLLFVVFASRDRRTLELSPRTDLPNHTAKDCTHFPFSSHRKCSQDPRLRSNSNHHKTAPPVNMDTCFSFLCSALPMNPLTFSPGQCKSLMRANSFQCVGCEGSVVSGLCLLTHLILTAS